MRWMCTNRPLGWRPCLGSCKVVSTAVLHSPVLYCVMTCYDDHGLLPRQLEGAPLALPQPVVPHLGETHKKVPRAGEPHDKLVMNQKNEDALVDVRPWPKLFQQVSYELPGEHPVTTAARHILPVEDRELVSTYTVFATEHRGVEPGVVADGHHPAAEAAVDATSGYVAPRGRISAATSAKPATCQPAILATRADPGPCLFRARSPIEFRPPPLPPAKAATTHGTISRKRLPR